MEEPITATFNPTTLELLPGDEERAPQQIRSITIEIGRLNHYLDSSQPLAQQITDIITRTAEGDL